VVLWLGVGAGRRRGWKVTLKLTCPRCQNDTFKLALSRRHETSETGPQATRMTVVTFLYITCARCRWSRRLAEG